MKALKTKVLLSAFVLLFALVATVGSTFAWFTVSNQVSVDQFELNVQTSDSLLIRVFAGENVTDDLVDLQDANSYSTNLTSQMIKEAGPLYATFDTWRLTPVTAVQFADNNLTVDTPKLNPFNLQTLDLGVTSSRNHVANAVENNATTGNFIELKFWVMSQSATNKDLYLQNLVISPSTVNPLPGQEKVANAVRLGVGMSSGALVSNGEEPATFSLAAPTEGFVFGVRDAAADLLKPYGFTFSTGMRGLSATAALNKINQPVGQEILKEHAIFIDDVVAYQSDALALATKLTGTALLPNTPQLITVRIYIEGWDHYANNSIIAAKFNISFQFAIPQTT